MKKVMTLFDKNEKSNSYEIDLNDVLCFETDFIDSFILHSKNIEHDGLRYYGSSFDLSEEIDNSDVEFMSESITQDIVYFKEEEIIETTIIKNIIYNVKNALFAIEKNSETKYDVSINFVNNDKNIRIKYDTFWGDEDVIWLRSNYPECILV